MVEKKCRISRNKIDKENKNKSEYFHRNNYIKITFIIIGLIKIINRKS